jgi:uncharacterized protein HemX
MMEEFPARPTPLQAAEAKRRQKGRNTAMLVGLLLLAALFFAITLVKFSQQ